MHMFGEPSLWPADDRIAVTGPPDADAVLQAYREGVFPMRLADFPPARRLMAWFSPAWRGILPLDGLRVSTSLRSSMSRYTLTVDTDFPGVLAGCADRRRPHGWIDGQIEQIYGELFARGVVHTVETRDSEGRLVGGLYGVSVGGLFAGESMFHDPVLGRDASKTALVGLVQVLAGDGPDDQTGPQRLLDVQWQTDHLATLGAVEVSRTDYLARLAAAVELPAPVWPARIKLPRRPRY